jgi:hypothetical protein
MDRRSTRRFQPSNRQRRVTRRFRLRRQAPTLRPALTHPPVSSTSPQLSNAGACARSPVPPGRARVFSRSDRENELRGIGPQPGTSRPSAAERRAGTGRNCYSDGLMGYVPRTSTHRRRGEPDSPTTTVSRAAPPAARPSSAGRTRSVPGSARWGCPELPSGCSPGSHHRDGAEGTRVRDPASSTRTTWLTRTSTCRPCTGFDEFLGNLYHLNAEEEPEPAGYPVPADFANVPEQFGPRGVIHSWANKDGTQRIELIGIGFSHHRVPSLSKTARSSTAAEPIPRRTR